MSMRAALEDFALTASRSGHGRRIAVLGDMLELGPAERRFHEELGPTATAAGVDLLITVGPLAAAIGDRFAGETLNAYDAAQAAAMLERELRPGDLILVKGSRAVGLELVCRSLTEGAPV
jgi:UDP-N-acetylmuramyl pentapeptide synthase